MQACFGFCSMLYCLRVKLDTLYRLSPKVSEAFFFLGSILGHFSVGQRSKLVSIAGCRVISRPSVSFSVPFIDTTYTCMPFHLRTYNAERELNHHLSQRSII